MRVLIVVVGLMGLVTAAGAQDANPFFATEIEPGEQIAFDVHYKLEWDEQRAAIDVSTGRPILDVTGLAAIIHGTEVGPGDVRRSGSESTGAFGASDPLVIDARLEVKRPEVQPDEDNPLLKVWFIVGYAHYWDDQGREWEIRADEADGMKRARTILEDVIARFDDTNDLERDMAIEQMTGAALFLMRDEVLEVSEDVLTGGNRALPLPDDLIDGVELPNIVRTEIMSTLNRFLSMAFPVVRSRNQLQRPWTWNQVRYEAKGMEGSALRMKSVEPERRTERNVQANRDDMTAHLLLDLKSGTVQEHAIREDARIHREFLGHGAGTTSENAAADVMLVGDRTLEEVWTLRKR
jgi:hypothetical protein